MNKKLINKKNFLIFFMLILICVIFYIRKNKQDKVPFIGIGYNLEYKSKIFPNMTDLEIDEIINKITIAASERTKEGKKFKITEEELEKLGITGLDPYYLDMIKISTE
ncbi:hypothetical protein AAK964_14490 [Tissierella praeacuta]|uniref:hypothetical protein n=1 Tax=Tissierella praeacuta TaxID=43131 RepID=UPI0035161992